MKKLLFILFAFGMLDEIRSQDIYINSEDRIYRLDLATCTYEFMVVMDRQMTDLTFHPDGTIYGISGDGFLFIMDFDEGQSWSIHKFPGFGGFTSLTTSGDGIVYAANTDGELWSYNNITDLGTLHGYFPGVPTGDLTFHDGDLYAAITDHRIMRIDIEDPPSSEVVINDDVPGEIWGIVSYAEDCDDVRTYAISNGNSVIYLINFETLQLEPVCTLDIEVWGGASTYEFFASAPVYFDSVLSVNPTCNENNGSITIHSSGGIGILRYSLNGAPFQASNTFYNLSAGYYVISVKDQNGCIVSSEVELTGDQQPVIENIELIPVTCGMTNGQISVTASGGNGLLTYSIDGVAYQSSGVFSGLNPGVYNITVLDALGCYANESIELNVFTPALIDSVVVTYDPCMENEGTATIITAGNVSLFSIDGSAFQGTNYFGNLSSGNYSGITEDEHGCRDTTYFLVEESHPLQIDETEIINFDCKSLQTTVRLLHSGGHGIIQYFKDGVLMPSSDQKINLSSGLHSITATDAAGCSDTEVIAIEDYESIVIQNITTQNSDCGSQNGSIEVEVTGGQGLIMASLDQAPLQAGLSFPNLNSDIYHLQLVDEKGCVVDTVAEVSYGDCEIYIPNTFSPNGDGVNDFFQISSHAGAFLTIKKYLLFDRWGNNVHAAYEFPISSEEHWWDGSYKRMSMSEGVFAYYIEIVNKNGTIQTHKGNVTLVR